MSFLARSLSLYEFYNRMEKSKEENSLIASVFSTHEEDKALVEGGGVKGKNRMKFICLIFNFSFAFCVENEASDTKSSRGLRVGGETREKHFCDRRIF